MSVPTYNEQMRRIVNRYQASGECWPATTQQMAAWAIQEGLWALHPNSAVNQCAEHLARAMREEYITDPQGRTVRAKHAARTEENGKQQVLWDDIRTADCQHMQIAFQQRRQQIVGDCRQLKTDVDSYNENGNPAVPIQMIFDFTEDLAEIEALESMEAMTF